jgi:hypothetical protein
LPVTAAVKVTENHHFNEIEEGHSLLASQLLQLTIEIPAYRHELHGQPLLLIVAPRFEIDAVSRA